MEVGVLGPTQVRRSARPEDAALVSLGTPKQRALLAGLALHRGRPVSADALVDLLWGEDPPAAVSGTLQSYVAGLRRALEPDRAPRAPATVLVTVGTGYALQVPAEGFDAAVFEQVVSTQHARLRPDLPADELADLVGALDDALALWRGRAYADLEDAAAAVAERARLEELRLVALEDRAVANLARGQHSVAAAELEALTAAHPLRERLWALRALALARSHRQAEALEVLREVRTLLAEELGLEPGAELRDLQAALLRQDPALDWQPPRTATPPATAAVPAAPPTAAPAAPPAAWPMVGRDEQLAALVGLLDRAEAGSPGFAAVTGDAGIGKTRLWSELAAVAASRGALVLTGRCSQDDGAPPLWPWVPVLAGLGHELPGATASDREDEGAQFRSWEAVVEAVTGAARERLVVVVLDDLHWSDRSSLRVLRLLVETASTGRLLVVTTWRPHPPPREALADVVESLARRHALRLDLAGLDAAAAGEVVAAVARARPTYDEAATLTARTDGNPFFLVEYARLATEGGDLAALLAEDDPPTAVHDVIVRRLERLPEGTRALLRVAAVVGREFDTDTVATAAGRAADDVLDDLEPAQAAGLVREDGVDAWAFAHALVRDTVYAGLALTRRARVHARVAEALAGRGRETEEALHWRAAGPAHAARAWRSAASAADLTRRLHAHDQSVELLTAGLESLDEDPEASEEDRWGLMARLADAYRWTGQWRQLVGLQMEGVALAERMGDDVRLAEAASTMTLSLWQSAPFGEVAEPLVAALHRCLDRLPAGDSRSRCLVLLSLANEEYFRAPYAERRVWYDEGLAMARRLDDPRLLLDALMIGHIAAFTPATAAASRELLLEATELAVRLDDDRGRVVATTLLAVVEGELGLVEEMHRSAAAALEGATRLRHRYALVILDALELPWLAMAGRFEECDRRLERMRRMIELMADATGDEDILTQVAMSRWRGVPADLPDRVAAFDEPGSPFGATVAVCLLGLGEVEKARDYLAEHPVELDHDSWLSPMVWCHAAEVALALGDADLAKAAYARLEPIAGRSSSAGAHNAMGPVDGFLALAAAAAGDTGRATEHAEDALRLMELWDVPLAADRLREARARHGF